MIKSIKAAAALMFIVFSAPSYALMITETVGGMDTLYFTDWGHIYNEGAGDGTQFNALGTGVAASSVESGGGAFNFSGAVSIGITASGHVVDDGPNATDANGDPNAFMDGLWRGLPVYSLIGMWSTTPDAITPIGDPSTAPFFIGTNLLLSLIDIPDVPQLYLFLAENDGLFGDNEGYYKVNLDVQFVPIPASGVLLLSGLLGMFATRLGAFKKKAA